MAEPANRQQLSKTGAARLRESRDGLFTSDLTVNEYLLIEDAGFEPVGLVVGSSIYHVGFLAVGTAVRHRSDDGHLPAHGRPFTSDLSGQDFWTLLRTGARPVGLVLGSCVYGVARYTGLGTRAWRNLELPDFTQALYDARELAMTRRQREASDLTANGIVSVQLQEHQHGWDGRAIAFLAIGTAITRHARTPHSAPASPQPVIDLNDK